MFEKTMKKEKSESGRKFDEIWEKHHDPEHRKRKAIKKRREQRVSKKKKDYGL